MMKIVLSACPVCGARNIEAIPTLTGKDLKMMDPEVQNRIPPDAKKKSYYKRFTVAVPPDIMQLPLTDDAVEDYDLEDCVQRCDDGSYLFASQTDTEPRNKVRTYCCEKCHMILPPVLLRKKNVHLKRVLMIGPTSAGKTTTMTTIFGVAGSLKAGAGNSYENCYYMEQLSRQKSGFAPLPTLHGLEIGIINRQPILYLYHKDTNTLYTLIDVPGEVVEEMICVWTGTNSTAIFLLNCDENRTDFDSDYETLKRYAEMYRSHFTKCVLNFTQCDVMPTNDVESMMLQDLCTDAGNIMQDDLAVAREQSVKYGLNSENMRKNHPKIVQAANEFQTLFRNTRFSIVFSAALGVPVRNEVINGESQGKLQGPFSPRYMQSLLHAIL